MNASNSIKNTPMPLADVARAQVATYLYELFANDDGLLANLDRWTQRRITEENMAKLALVFESDDPAEACYRDLIREIDTEAEYGIYLAKADADGRHLSRIIDEPGVSGELGEQMDTVARTMFPDELTHSDGDLDLVWITIQARHDRAHVDAQISMIIMDHISGDADMTADMTNAMRSLQYGHHENVVRRCCDLNLLTDDRGERDLMIMVAELTARSGSYENRVTEIGDRVDRI
ncbi:MAG: hypothetical protein ACR2QS_02055 [Woeseiaceae bacterium]